MPNGIFLGSSDPEFTRRVMLDHYEPDPTKLKKGLSEWHNFFIDVIDKNKISNDITDEELEKWFPYKKNKVEFSKKCLIAIAHCQTCAKPSVIKRYCPNCPYEFKQFIL